MLLTEKIDIKGKKFTTEKEEHFIILKEIIH